MTMTIQQTGEGYQYVRCRAGGDDSTVYLHQLDAIAGGADPRDVFSPEMDVHHLFSIPWLNYPENVELRESYAHRVGHLEGTA